LLNFKKAPEIRGLFYLQPQNVTYNAVMSYKVSDHLGLAFSFASKYVKPHEEVVDTEQYSEALLGLWDAVLHYDGRSEFSTFAYRCMTNKVREGFRNRNRFKHKVADVVGQDVLDAVESPPSRPTMSQEDIRRLVKPLPGDTFYERRNKKILGQHYLNGLSWAEIARRNKITRSAARQGGLSAMELIRRQYCSVFENEN
jgi:RNA polymerase sigma factor (sigma-70 family)